MCRSIEKWYKEGLFQHVLVVHLWHSIITPHSKVLNNYNMWEYMCTLMESSVLRGVVWKRDASLCNGTVAVTCIHLYTLICTHAHTHTHPFTCTHAHTRMHIHTHTCTHWYTYTHIHIHTRKRASFGCHEGSWLLPENVLQYYRWRRSSWTTGEPPKMILSCQRMSFSTTGEEGPPGPQVSHPRWYYGYSGIIRPRSNISMLHRGYMEILIQYSVWWKLMVV